MTGHRYSSGPLREASSRSVDYSGVPTLALHPAAGCGVHAGLDSPSPARTHPTLAHSPTPPNPRYLPRARAPLYKRRERVGRPLQPPCAAPQAYGACRRALAVRPPWHRTLPPIPLYWYSVPFTAACVRQISRIARAPYLYISLTIAPNLAYPAKRGTATATTKCAGQLLTPRHIA